MAFTCQLCSFRSSTWRLWLRHTFEAHSSEPTFHLRCGIGGCCLTFKHLSSMLSHLSRKHPGQCEISSNNPSSVGEEESKDVTHYVHDTDDPVPSSGELRARESEDTSDDFRDDQPTSELVETPGSYNDTNTNENVDPLERVTSNSSSSRKKAAGIFLLTLKEQHRLTQTSVNFALSQVKLMMSNIVQDVQCKVENELQQHLASTGFSVPDLNNCFKSTNPFEGFETEHMQTKFYRQHFNLLVSDNNCSG